MSVDYGPPTPGVFAMWVHPEKCGECGGVRTSTLRTDALYEHRGGCSERSEFERDYTQMMNGAIGMLEQMRTCGEQDRARITRVRELATANLDGEGRGWALAVLAVLDTSGDERH